MKDIMAKESSTADQGVPSFAYNPSLKTQGLLFELSRPLDELGGLLLNRFASQQLTMKEIYERHNVGTPFIEQNYKAVLMSLEREGKITADPPASKRRANSFADHVLVTFPGRS